MEEGKYSMRCVMDEAMYYFAGEKNHGEFPNIPVPWSGVEGVDHVELEESRRRFTADTADIKLKNELGVQNEMGLQKRTGSSKTILEYNKRN